MNIGRVRNIRLLFVTRQNFLVDEKSGGNKLSKNLFQSFRMNQNFEVALCILDTTKFSYVVSKYPFPISIIPIEDTAIKRNISYIFGHAGYNRQEICMLKTVLENSDADVFFFDGTWFGENVKYIDKRRKIIVFCHNIEKIFAFDRIKKTKKITAIPRFFSDWHNEKEIIRRATGVICLNERDNNLLKINYSRSADAQLPIMIEDDGGNNFENNKLMRKILFVGSFFYANVEGIRWFCDNVMPFIDCKLEIVGKGMEILKEELESEKIEVIGTVDSVREYYLSADLVVLPIFSGGGMKVKTAEALMYGKRLVATEEAIEGYEFLEACDISCCKTANDFIDTINSIMQEPEFYKYSKANREIYMKNHSTEAVQRKLVEFVEEIVNGKS